MVKSSTLAVILAALIISVALTAEADGAGLVWRAVNKAGSSIHDISNVTSIGCGLNQYLSVNSSAKWACTTLTTGSNTLLDGSVHTDTVAQTVSRGSIIYGDSTPKWNELTIGSNGQFLYSSALDTSWKTFQVWNQTVSAGTFITGINNATGVITTQTFEVQNQTVSAGTAIVGINNVTGVITTSNGLPVILTGANRTTSSSTLLTNIWGIPLTANSGNFISAYIIAASPTSGNAVQFSTNTTQTGNTTPTTTSEGNCIIASPTTNVNMNFTQISIVTGASTGVTAWLNANSTAVTINCGIVSGPAPGSLNINFKSENNGNFVRIVNGSFYIKTP